AAAGGDGVVAHGSGRGDPGVLPSGHVVLEEQVGVVLVDVNAVDLLGGLVAVADVPQEGVGLVVAHHEVVSDVDDEVQGLGGHGVVLLVGGGVGVVRDHLHVLII